MDSGFHNHRFRGFWIPQAKISQIPKSDMDYLTRCDSKVSAKWKSAVDLHVHDMVVYSMTCFKAV